MCVLEIPLVISNGGVSLPMYQEVGNGVVQIATSTNCNAALNTHICTAHTLAESSAMPEQASFVSNIQGVCQ